MLVCSLIKYGTNLPFPNHLNNTDIDVSNGCWHLATFWCITLLYNYILASLFRALTNCLLHFPCFKRFDGFNKSMFYHISTKVHFAHHILSTFLHGDGNNEWHLLQEIWKCVNENNISVLDWEQGDNNKDSFNWISLSNSSVFLKGPLTSLHFLPIYDRSLFFQNGTFSIANCSKLLWNYWGLFFPYISSSYGQNIVPSYLRYDTCVLVVFIIKTDEKPYIVYLLSGCIIKPASGDNCSRKGWDTIWG